MSTPHLLQVCRYRTDFVECGRRHQYSFEKLFDLRGGIKRQRIQVDIAELRKQEAYETLKIQIAHLYVQILSNIETLQRSAEI